MSDILDSLAKPPPPPSELDELMSRNPLDMTKTHIDDIIAYHRNIRAQREAAPKGRKKDLVDMTGQALDLSALGLVKPTPAAPVISKPAGGGLRRF